MTQETGLNILHQKLKTVSERAGVYRMLDSAGKVLYVGKAKNLKKRLTNYTHLDRLSTRIRQMVSEIADVITIETAGEAEALILENNLIKEYRPYYNILLKDDKSYPYILITREETPRLMKYRGNRKGQGDYFGPFTSGLMVQQTLKELQKIFGLRTCNNTYFHNRTRPCLLYQIGRCSAPCTGCISPSDYAQRVHQTLAFLRGESIPLQSELQAQMRLLSNQERYEEAALVRDKLMALNHIQNTDSETPLYQTDIVAFYRQGDSACVQVFFYRSGHAEGNIVHFLNNIADTDDMTATFLMQFYDQIPPPKHILISDDISPDVARALSERAGFQITIDKPMRGDKKKWMTVALENAEHSYHQHVQEAHIRQDTWEELRTLLNIPHLEKIEVYDNSHIQGSFAVGAMIAANQEGFQKKWYRRFNITFAQTNDDFGMMKEVLMRRLTRGIKEKDLPSAFLIDGGKGQLASVMEILNDLKVENIAVLAIAKGENRNAGMETFYLGTAPNKPIHLDLKGDLIHLLQRLRDEAHRFAIGTHRAKRAKNMLHETLLDIEDIGEKRKKALILHFGSARAVAGASLDQLMRVPKISEKIAKKVYTFFHG
ncbi:MAG: excinuclease ABC subunit UvrC [Alphaproteobacteria bacterium]|nr:excinuclease ABC subunit UvrC [Alphaproteobacteria bacterium]